MTFTKFIIFVKMRKFNLFFNNIATLTAFAELIGVSKTMLGQIEREESPLIKQTFNIQFTIKIQSKY
jgi:DNA-binding XRE family transcriptional regulator